MSNYQEVIDLAQSLTGNKNLYHLQPFIKITGDSMFGLFLERVVYWSDRSGNKDLRQLKTFYKTAEEWQDEIGFSYAQVTTARKKIETMGFIKTSKHKIGGAPTLHYYANMDAIKDAIIKYYQENCDYTNLDNLEIQEVSISENAKFQIQETPISIEIQETSISLNNSSNPNHNSRKRDVSNPEIKPGQLGQAILDICRLDWIYVKDEPSLQRPIIRLIKFLETKEAAPDDVREFDTWRMVHHWTGRDSSPSTPRLIGELWAQYQHWINQGRPTPENIQKASTNGTHSRHNKPSQPTGQQLKQERTYDFHTDEYVYPDGRREPAGSSP